MSTVLCDLPNQAARLVETHAFWITSVVVRELKTNSLMVLPDAKLCNLRAVTRSAGNRSWTCCGEPVNSSLACDVALDRRVGSGVSLLACRGTVLSDLFPSPGMAPNSPSGLRNSTSGIKSIPAPHAVMISAFHYFLLIDQVHTQPA